MGNPNDVSEKKKKKHLKNAALKSFMVQFQTAILEKIQFTWETRFYILACKILFPKFAIMPKRGGQINVELLQFECKYDYNNHWFFSFKHF